MNILVAGGHGQIALRLLKLLAEQGHTARGLIRKPEQADDLMAVGAVPVLGDLENDESLSAYVEGADAVVFAAGAGPGSSADRKRTVDLGGAVKLADAAKAAGVSRYVIVSSIGADQPDVLGDSMRPYLQAKAEADAYVQASGLDWTVVRPGSLTDEPGTGRVRLTSELGNRGPVPARRRGSGPGRGPAGAEHDRRDGRAVHRRHPDRRGRRRRLGLELGGDLQGGPARVALPAAREAVDQPPARAVQRALPGDVRLRPVRVHFAEHADRLLRRAGAEVQPPRADLVLRADRHPEAVQFGGQGRRPAGRPGPGRGPGCGGLSAYAR